MPQHFCSFSEKHERVSTAYQQAPSISSQVLGKLLTPRVLTLFSSASQTLISGDGAEPGAASSKQAPGQLIHRVSCAIMFICRILDDIHGAK